MTIDAQTFISFVTITVVANVILLACAYLIFLERKVAAWTQDRLGPNRTRFTFGQDDILAKIPGLHLLVKYRLFGLGQALADGVKLLLKEDYNPPHVEKALFMLAPILAVVPAIIGWAVIPWGGYWDFPGFSLLGLTVEAGFVYVMAAPVNVGVIYILAIGSLGVYGVVLAGYASNNKYSFLGGLRATAQMISYEIPQGICVLVILLMAASTATYTIVDTQVGAGSGGAWFILYQPLLAVIFFTCVLAECNRAPFDLAEAEQELVGGFHTEYASMKWALFFLGEYMHMITGSAFFVLLFLGGWSLNPIGGLIPLDLPLVAGLPGGGQEPSVLMSILIVLAKVGVFAAKVTLCLFVMMWVRWTLPRFRFDQLMQLAWRGLIPTTVLILVCSGLLAFFSAPLWTHLLGNIIAAAAVVFIGPLIPKGPPVNRRIGLAGSRFSPPAAETA